MSVRADPAGTVTAGMVWALERERDALAVELDGIRHAYVRSPGRRDCCDHDFDGGFRCLMPARSPCHRTSGVIYRQLELEARPKGTT